MRSHLVSLLFASACCFATFASAAERPVVVELFTSEGCSSCPPADAFLTELSRGRRDVLPLAFHVTYWDSLGWKDPYSLEAATARQASYAGRLGGGSYTPEMVVDGARGFVGSRRGEGDAAIREAQSSGRTDAAITLGRNGDHLSIDVGQGSGHARVLLVGFDPEHRTSIGRGENSGRTLVESNIVRSVHVVGTWDGSALHLDPSRPAGQDAAVLLQRGDGTIVGAARLDSDS